MAATTTSADPDRLRSFAQRCLRLDAEIDRQAQHLAAAFRRWYDAPNDAYARALTHGELPVVEDLGTLPSGDVVQRTARYARRFGNLDLVVLKVGKAFERVTGAKFDRGVVEADAAQVRRLIRKLDEDEATGEHADDGADKDKPSTDPAFVPINRQAWLAGWLRYYREERPHWQLPVYHRPIPIPMPRLPMHRPILPADAARSPVPADVNILPMPWPRPEQRWPPFDFHAAEGLATTLRTAASTIDERHGQRQDLAHHELDSWKGGFRDRFDERFPAIHAVAPQLVEQLRRMAGTVDEVIEASHRIEYLWQADETDPVPPPPPTPPPTPTPPPSPTPPPTPVPPPVPEPPPPPAPPPEPAPAPDPPPPPVMPPTPVHAAPVIVPPPPPTMPIPEPIAPAPDLVGVAKDFDKPEAPEPEPESESPAGDESDQASPADDGNRNRVIAGPALLGAGAVGLAAHKMRRKRDEEDEGEDEGDPFVRRR